MISRHQNDLMALLERVADRGHAEVELTTLKRWYDKERLSKAMFRDIADKYAEVESSPLFIGDLGGAYAFIYSDGLTASSNSWFKPMDEWLMTW